MDWSQSKGYLNSMQDVHTQTEQFIQLGAHKMI